MPEGCDRLCRKVLYAGTVQGVGFRYTAERVARRFEMTGYVRNLPDGRVELVAEGDRAVLERFLGELEAVMGDCIVGREVTDGPATGDRQGFAIRY